MRNSYKCCKIGINWCKIGEKCGIASKMMRYAPYLHFGIEFEDKSDKKARKSWKFVEIVAFCCIFVKFTSSLSVFPHICNLADIFAQFCTILA